MSQFATTAHSNPIVFGGRKRAIKNKPIPQGGTSRMTLTFALVALICAMGVFYIFEVNNVATQGYAIRDLEKQAQDLRNSNEKLKIKEAEFRSLNNIEEKTKDLNMAAPKDVSYMALPGNVAMR